MTRLRLKKSQSCLFIGICLLAYARMPHKRKQDYCLNCNEPLSPNMNYCPSCGQENDDRHVSIWVLVADYLEELLGVDSKMVRSIIPFLLQPGKLTVSFRSGQRKRYVPPMRMYLVISVAFFFLTAISINREVQRQFQESKNGSDPYVTEDSTEVDSADHVNIGFNGKQLLNLRLDTSTKVKPVSGDTSKKKRNTPFKDLAKNDSLSDSAVVARLDMGDVTPIKVRLVHQLRRFYTNNDEAVADLVGFLTENASFAGLVLLPFLALILKLLFRKSNTRFVIHLVHALHLCTFLLFLMIVDQTMDFLIDDAFWGEVYESLSDILVLAILIYTLVSLKRVYENSWPKTILKFLIFWILSLFSFFIVAMLFAFVGFVFF